MLFLNFYIHRNKYFFGTKFIRAGFNVNVIINDVINPIVIIHPKSIIGFISLKIKDKKAIIVVKPYIKLAKTFFL